MSDDRFELDVTGGDRSEPSKREATPAPPPPPSSSEDDDISVIVKVRRAKYVPPGFDLQTRIDDMLFTARASADAIEAADDDPDVASISPARSLRND